MTVRNYDLPKNWFLITDPHKEGEASGFTQAIPDAAVACEVPSTVQQYFPAYAGIAYYYCRFTPQLSPWEGERLLLRFGGVNYFAKVWLNGNYLGEYEGGETPFVFDVTDTILPEKENLLCVRVLTPSDEMIDGMNLRNTPQRNTRMGRNAGSNLVSGGLYYGVSLEAVPGVYLQDPFFTGDIHTGQLTAQVQLCNTTAEACPVTLGLQTAGCQQTVAVTAQPGLSTHTVTLIVPNVHLWSTEDPYLYSVTLCAESHWGSHDTSVRFGFRELTLKGGYFHLNGKKFFLKCAHSGNIFPVGQMCPADPDQMRRDFILAKACGFNALRSIAGLFRPEQLDLADEMGLLVYEECYASWCMGNTDRSKWTTQAEYDALIAEKGYTPLGDIPTMLQRFDHATASMIRRDRNHACVGIWGLLNETFDSPIFRNAVAFLPKARALDPTRLILLSSGRWDLDFSIGSASLPYSEEWDAVWGEDGNTDYPKNHPELTTGDLGRRVGDVHYYPSYPVSQKGFSRIANLGKDSKPVILSECGIGAQFHVIEEWKEFLARGIRPDLEDAAWLHAQSEALTKDWFALGLDAVYPFPEMMLKESQRKSAQIRRLLFDHIRANPNINGYSLTGLLDHGMCGEGLWSYWRRMKPEVFDAVSDGWANLRFCLLCPRHIYSGQEFPLNVWLANEGLLGSGRYTARFAITCETGTVMQMVQSFQLDGDALAVPVGQFAPILELPTGKYTLTASLDEAAPAGNSLEFYVTNKADWKPLQATVYALGLEQTAVDFLNTQGVQVLPAQADATGTVLVDALDPETMEKAVQLAQQGAQVLFLRSEPFRQDPTLLPMAGVGEGLVCKEYRDWLYYKEAVILENTIHQGLGHGLVDWERYGDCFPHLIFRADRYPDTVICPCFVTGYYGVSGGYGLSYAACAYQKGQGRLVFNSFPIIENLGTPAADRMLLNYLQYLA